MKKKTARDPRVGFLFASLIVFACLIVVKLFVLQLMDHGFYEALASGQHELFQELFPERGKIFVRDEKDNSLVAVATNRELVFVYADPRNIDDADEAAERLGAVLDYDATQVDALEGRLDQPDDPYEPVAKGLTDDQWTEIKALNLAGIHHIYESSRYYPESGMGGHVVGFVGSDADGRMSGKYGIEGYFDEELSGTPGFLRSDRDLSGRLIAVGDRSFEPAVDGADVVLTIDRTIQYVACTKLKEAVAKNQADGGSVIVVEPSTGRILAMCGTPDFDPNDYREVDSIDVYNNPAIFKAYEPGSIFKAITMAAALDSGAVTPTTTYEDTGEVVIEPYTIKNSDEKANGIQTMTQVLEKSLNTGAIFAMRETGQDLFAQYVRAFGFGEYSGIELQTESSGTIVSLDSTAEIFAATASYGQGITATPLQMAMAFTAIANGGMLMEPQIVDELRFSDGTVETREPSEVRRVLTEKAARELGAMLISVVERGHGQKAGVAGYYIAGKTGTAQVAGGTGGGYEEGNTIGSFAGFGPVNDPKFAMIVRIDRPRSVIWAESTAAPLFGEIADFLLRYYEVPPER